MLSACSTSTITQQPNDYYVATNDDGRELVEEPETVIEEYVEVYEEYIPPVIDPIWLPLYERLTEDNVYSPALANYFAMLPAEISQDPMGRKIDELYGYEFVPRTTPSTPTPSSNYDYPPAGFEAQGPWYKNIVTNSIAQQCIDFIETYQATFDKAATIYGVPQDLIAALMFIETRLGGYLGVENAFYTLASMASSTHYTQIPDFFNDLPNNPENNIDWINNTMEIRSDWAYNEFKALSVEIINNDLDPFDMPGSIYGAIGLCQFMPSNIQRFSADGDGDGIINLFNPNDAIMSVAKYLEYYGWETSGTLSERHAALKKYNNSSVYANTILGLAETIRLIQSEETLASAE